MAEATRRFLKQTMSPRLAIPVKCAHGLPEGVTGHRCHLSLRWAFFFSVGHLEGICFDSQTDWDLLIVALNYQVPPWVEPRNVCYEIGDLLYQDFFAREGLPEHHALYDARANAYAFRERIAPIEVTGSERD